LYIQKKTEPRLRGLTHVIETKRRKADVAESRGIAFSNFGGVDHPVRYDFINDRRLSAVVKLLAGGLKCLIPRISVTWSSKTTAELRINGRTEAIPNPPALILQEPGKSVMTVWIYVDTASG